MASSTFPDEDTSVLLNELKEISNKYSSRQSKPVTKESHSTPSSTEKENYHSNTTDGSLPNEFLQQTTENRELNQYWYSKKTIDILCNAIRESCLISGGKRVAFLSTPSLFFSVPDEEREGCVLFDVSSKMLLPSVAVDFYHDHAQNHHSSTSRGVLVQAITFMTTTKQQTLILLIAISLTWSSLIHHSFRNRYGSSTQQPLDYS
jgi:hypothetical protein